MASNIPGIDARVTKLEETNIPIGGIIAFSGTFGGTNERFPIPQGSKTPNTNWCLCDGIATNGLPVPDLRGRMILGASDDRPAGSTGGSETHEHSLSGTVGATTPTVSQMPGHNHYTALQNGDGGGNGTQAFDSTSSPWGTSDYYSSIAGGSQAHTHSLEVSTGATSNLPPYYTLAYIMRIA